MGKIKALIKCPTDSSKNLEHVRALEGELLFLAFLSSRLEKKRVSVSTTTPTLPTSTTPTLTTSSPSLPQPAIGKNCTRESVQC